MFTGIIISRLRTLLGDKLEELYPIIGVSSREALVKLEEAYAHLRRRETVRNAVMALQRKHGIFLAPNESLSRTTMKIRLKQKIVEKNCFLSTDEEETQK